MWSMIPWFPRQFSKGDQIRILYLLVDVDHGDFVLLSLLERQVCSLLRLGVSLPMRQRHRLLLGFEKAL
jgi:hypothetical protein